MSGEEFWEDHVRLQKRKDHFLWTIESTGKARRDLPASLVAYTVLPPGLPSPAPAFFSGTAAAPCIAAAPC